MDIDQSPAHRFRTDLAWQGSTGQGYAAYDRGHTVRAEPASAQLHMSSSPAFRGDPARLNPEQLLVAALSSCQMLSFLALAARHHVDVVAYRDEATALMPVRSGWVESAELRPVIEVRGLAEVGAVLALVAQAHEECFIARSVRTQVMVKAEVKLRAEG